MPKRLDQLLVVDVESTCWDGEIPAGQMSEIIEIGLCPVDLRSLERLEKRSILVRPCRSQVGPFCTSLTTITPEMVADAGTLAEATEILREQYRSRQRLWSSWGDYDREQFDAVCSALGVEYPFGKSHLNVKTLFATARGMSREVGLAAAYSKLGWEMEGTHHRGHDDAWNIARVLCWLLKAGREALA